MLFPSGAGTAHATSCSATSQTFELLDRDEREETHLALADLPQHVEKFGFIIGVQRRTFRDQDPVNIEASELIARLHDALKASGYDGHDLELFLVRTVFCLFADDTGIDRWGRLTRAWGFKWTPTALVGSIAHRQAA